MNEDKARELAKRFGVRMCDENGDTYDAELYCLGVDDIIDMAKALAQPDQEPVGYWMGEFNDGSATLYEVPQESVFGRKYRNIPVYTTPPTQCNCLQRQCNVNPLTDEQINQIERYGEFWIDGTPLQFARAIEAAHGIKE